MVLGVRFNLCPCIVSATVIRRTQIRNAIRVRLIRGLPIMAPVLPVSGVLVLKGLWYLLYRAYCIRVYGTYYIGPVI